MYKVFFNDSSITLCSESENSFKDNNLQVIDFVANTNTSPLLNELETNKEAKNIILETSDLSKSWNVFKKQFIRIKAAGGVVVDKNGRILVIKRLGVWDLPKGKVEKNESLEEAAIREVEEECGITGLTIKKRIKSIFHLYRSPFHTKPNNFVLKKTFWFEMAYEGNEIPTPQVSENIVEARWMTQTELSDFFSNTYQNLAELMEEFTTQSTIQ